VSTGDDDKSLLSPSHKKSANLVEKVAEEAALSSSCENYNNNNFLAANNTGNTYETEYYAQFGLNEAEKDAEFDEDYDYDDEVDEDHINYYNHDGYAFNQVNEWAFLFAL
jgi:hypothetical protein